MTEARPPLLTPAQEAFTRQAPGFDRADRAEPMIAWVRDRVRKETLRWVAPRQRMLELNAGTGLDAAYFAQHGVHVLATENAPGMLDLLRSRSSAQPALPLETMDLDYHALQRLPAAAFDMVFSNFGGLNCTDRLPEVLAGIDHVLRPGGRCALVVMPRVSPWELVELLRGRGRYAFRRFHSGAVTARIEGVEFPCYYHRVGSLRRMLPTYRMRTAMALSLLVPPPHLGPFAARHPRFTRIMMRLEHTIARWPLLREWGDHVLVVLEKPWR